MKGKKYIIIGVISLIIVTAVVIIAQSSKWSKESFEAIVKETVIQSGGEPRLIVERTTEIYGNPINSLGISEETKLFDANGKEITISDLERGNAVYVALKSAFIEETLFYYPIVYEIRLINE